jgi:allantoate deiminase
MDGFEPALERLFARIEELGAITDTPGSLTRTFLSPANLKAARQVMAWMEEAGMKTGHDAGGTIRGVLPGNDSSLPPLLLGSHLDTVIDAGKYDGALGVLIAIAALEITGPRDFPVHVLGFSDEEGVRFPCHLPRQPCLCRADRRENARDPRCLGHFPRRSARE